MPRLRKNAARNVDATVASRSAIFLTSLVAVCGTSHAADPVVPGFVTETYATVSGPVALSFAADGKLFVGRDVPGSPSGAETVKIHRVGVGGSPVVEYGDEGIPDPDGVLADSDGSLSGIAGSVLVVGDGGKLLAILPDESLVTLSPNPSGMSNPNYIERGRDGAVITDSGVQKVFGFEAPDTLTPLITSPSPPGFLAIDEDGRIFVTHSDGVIRLWDADGMLVDTRSAAPARTTHPSTSLRETNSAPTCTQCTRTRAT